MPSFVNNEGLIFQMSSAFTLSENSLPFIAFLHGVEEQFYLRLRSQASKSGKPEFEFQLNVTLSNYSFLQAAVLSCKVEPNLPTSKGCLYIK
jgi:hypothetical protein